MSDHTPKDPTKLQRQRRLEEQLRENLKRRKLQTKARREPAPGERATPPAEDEREP